MSAIARVSILGLVFSSILALGCSSPDAEGRGNNGGPQGSGGNNSGTGGNGSQGKGGTGTILPGPKTLMSCGNGVVEPDKGEECDDGEPPKNGDGCTRLCQIEADWSCPPTGGKCTFGAVCGDGVLASTEACDDGNTVDGDGCSADCSAVDPGWQCRVPGKPCVPFCGDGMIIGGETCDDGNTVNGDGCSSTCLTEPGWSCETGTCVQSVCGDGVVQKGESCDAGMANGLFFGDGTGCSKTCTKEPNCREGGMTAACKTPCGDGNVDLGEECDDGNAVSGDGCSETCTLEPGFDCVKVPKKDTKPCASGLGECLELPITFRDFDGAHLPSGHPDFFFYQKGKTMCVPNASGANLLDLPENGTCPRSDATDPCTGLVNPTLGPDGKPVLNTASGLTCLCTFTDWDGTGLLDDVANAMQCNSGAASPRYVQNVAVKVIDSEASFKQWFSDSDKSDKVVSTLELAQIGATNQYQFSSSNGRTVYDDLHDIWLASVNMPRAGGATRLDSGFFPLENTMRPKLCNLWPYWVNSPTCVAQDNATPNQQWNPRGWNSGGAMPNPDEPLGTPVKPVTGVERNFYFTSEVRYLFRFVGGETLQFFGDDDVWVFINGKLVLDLGAPHERMRGTVTLTSGDVATWAISVQNVSTGEDLPIPGAKGSGMVTGLGLEVGKTYEIAIFHADRHPRESNYQLTLSGFSTEQTVCMPTCGDGVRTGAEECDEGPNNADGVYGGCTTECKFGPFCGDGIVDEEAGEECDEGRMNGVNAGYNETGCRASCKKPARCGDGVVDTAFGEQCDLGDGNNTDDGVCTSSCQEPVR